MDYSDGYNDALDDYRDGVERSMRGKKSEYRYGYSDGLWHASGGKELW